MFIRIAKTVVSYALILALGAAVGYFAANFPSYLKPSYIEGDYSIHYQGLSSKVVVYGTKSCPYCKQTRELLDQKQINYVDLDVQNDPEARKKFSGFGVSAVPVILIGNRRIDGFKPSVIEDSIAKLVPHN